MRLVYDPRHTYHGKKLALGVTMVPVVSQRSEVKVQAIRRVGHDSRLIFKWI